jgi:hypothetical protein
MIDFDLMIETQYLFCVFISKKEGLQLTKKQTHDQ